MTEERFTVLLARKLAGEILADELAELDQWIKNNPHDQFFTGILHSYWDSYSINPMITKTAEEHFENILQNAGNEKQVAAEKKSGQFGKVIKTTYWLKRLAVAALFIGLIVTSFFLIKKYAVTFSPMAASRPGEIIAGRGTRSQMVLPDGTKVWLNADSKLQFNQKFDDTVREVTLDGEAFFNVVKDARRPFIVHTSAIDIRVLGTSFNVKSYNEDNTIETTLIHGLVEVTNKLTPLPTRVILQPNEKLVFTKNNVEKPGSDEAITKDAKMPVFSIHALPEKIPDSSLPETSWKYNRLIFEGDTFSELAVKMERWFDVKISIKDKAVAGYRLRGTFENETIEETLEALKLIAPFNYRINGNEIEITK